MVAKGPGKNVILIHFLFSLGPEIHRDLISLLQKRLDQVTLDVIKDMLDKNAMSRLTVADVQVSTNMLDWHDTALSSVMIGLKEVI